MEQQRLSGHEVEQKGHVEELQVAHCAAVLSCGLDSPAPKRHPNEDALGFVYSARGCLVGVVADGHFGRESAELTVRAVLSQVVRSEGAATSHSFVERAGMAMDLVARQLQSTNMTSACATVVARLHQEELIWLSCGDCRLLHVSAEGTSSYLSPLDSNWVGAGYRARELHTGHARIPYGDRILMCSDGLPECRYGVETLLRDELARLSIIGDLRTSARALAQAALDGGGEDNIGLILIESSRDLDIGG